MDMLRDIFAAQAALNQDIIDKRNLHGWTDDEWIQKYMLALLSEMAETLNETQFKWWKNPKPANPDALRGELVDMLHFFLSMCLRAGMTADELYARYMDKNKENLNRQAGKSDKPGYDAREMI